MIIRSFYLIFKNNYNAFKNIEYIIFFIRSILFLTATSTIPYYILENTSQLSDNHNINNICKKIYNLFYFNPSFSILFIIHNSKLNKLLEISYNTKNNPNHLYLTLLTYYIYLIFAIVSSIKDFYGICYFLANTLSYTIFFNEIGYTFINTKYYNYKNKIDFFNNNSYIFFIYGSLVTFLTSLIHIKLFLPISFIIISIIQHAFINLNYNKMSSDFNTYNLIYFFENTFNIISSIIGNIIMYTLRNRNMIKIDY